MVVDDGHHVAVRVECALGAATGTTGEQDDGGIVLVDVGARHVGACIFRDECGQILFHGEDRDVCRQFGEGGAALGVHDQNLRT